VFFVKVKNIFVYVVTSKFQRDGKNYKLGQTSFFIPFDQFLQVQKIVTCLDQLFVLGEKNCKGG